MNGQVYWNSKKKNYSVKFGGKVALRTRSLVVRDAKFVVNPNGVDRIRKTKKKTVCATVQGRICIPTNPEHRPETRVRFNPYEMYEFQTVDGTPIHEAHEVHLTPNGVFVR